MEKPKHTPWTYERYNKSQGNLRGLVNADLTNICGISERHIGTTEADANARRIVAAVKARAGIPTDALEGGVVKELLECLKEALETCKFMDHDEGEGEGLPLAKWKAAIAKTEGN